MPSEKLKACPLTTVRIHTTAVSIDVIALLFKAGMSIGGISKSKRPFDSV